MHKKRQSFFARGDVEAAFKYARWAPALAFLLVYLTGGDLPYLTCAFGFSIWPIFKSLRES